MKQFKKGQAAMEFIMTYGWAIIIVAAALGVISYLGFFRGGNIPEQTTFGEPLVNIDQASIRTSEVQVSLRNDAADALVITDARILNARGNLEWTSCDATVSVVGEEKVEDLPVPLDEDDNPTADPFQITPGERAVFTFSGVSESCDYGQDGGRFDAIVEIDYTNEYTGLDSTHEGTIKGVIQG